MSLNYYSKLLRDISTTNKDTIKSPRYNPQVKVNPTPPLPKPKTNRKQFSKVKFNSNIFNLPADNKGIRTFSPNVHRRTGSTLSFEYNKPEPISCRPEKKPSDEIIKINDRKKLLPTEYYQKYGLVRNQSENSIGLSNKFVKKRSYPYVKDNVSKVLIQQGRKEDRLTDKVNHNSFDILKRVPKYYWET